MQQPRVKEVKTAIQKPLCRLCECPTSDGHVLASQVDRFKLRKWAMKVMNLTERDENLPEVVGEDALICYFCIWQAEFGDESGDEAVAWWPKNLDLDKNAKVLRENYSVGDVEQCWVQLEEVDLAKNTKNIPKKSKNLSGVCLYCGKIRNSLIRHIKYMHKAAIKCGFHGCATYFHTEEEKEQHMQQDLHEERYKPLESMKIRCKYCEIEKLFSSAISWRNHMIRMHPEFSEVCSCKGCKEYFKSKSEMIVHFNSCHKQGLNRDLFLCKHCEFFATKKFDLRKHVEGRHMPKIFKCDKCDAKFGSKMLVNRHYKQYHTFEKCKSCGQDVTLGYKPFHRKPSVCTKCKLSLECSGLYQLHLKKCKQSLISCKECEILFDFRYQLHYHVRRVHSKTVIFGCNHCDYSTFYKTYMVEHMQRKHFPKTFKCDECDKRCGSERILKQHKRKLHELAQCTECGQEERRQNMARHRTVKTCRRCKCKFKCRGLLANHIKTCDQSNSKDLFCDK